MKTTIELPNQLLDEVKTVAKREKRQIDEVVVELVREGLHHRPKPIEPNEDQFDAEQWMRNWFALADEVMDNAPEGPTARELLEDERSRLDRR